MNIRRVLVTAASVALLFGQVVFAQATGSITGKVSFEGKVPPPEKLQLGADPKCAAMHPQGLERPRAKSVNGGLGDVVVYVKSGATAAAAPATPVVIDQKGCNYVPHVVVLQVGQKLTIQNSDEVLHNIHARPTVNTEFNIGQPRKGMTSTKTFDKPEIMFPVGCDVHPWMRAFIAVVPNQFHAITKDDGTFEIKGLPAGDYEIEAVHEKLKGQAQKISVKAGAPAAANFTFKAPTQ